jgi:transcriptional regulator GlxA family with amidase domain
MSWALDHLTEPLDVDAMAARAAMSRRSFDRKFRGTVGVAPLQWLNAQRVMYAQRMLESTDLAMDQIAIRSGFGSLVAMRGHFRRMLSTSPTAYRSSFRTLPPDRRAPGDHWADPAEIEDPKDVSENIEPVEDKGDGQPAVDA